MKLYSPSTAIALLGVCLVTSQSLHAGIVIDDFETGDISLSEVVNSVVEESQTGLDPSRVIGGRRSIMFFVAGDEPRKLDVSFGKLTFQVDEDARGYFMLIYGTPDSPLNLDLLADGSNAFEIDFEAIDFQSGSLTLETSAGNRSVSLSSITPLQLPNDISRFVLPFDSFVGVNLGEINQIKLHAIRSSLSSQINLLSITTTAIPEPSTATMLSCISFAWLSRYERIKSS